MGMRRSLNDFKFWSEDENRPDPNPTVEGAIP
jgi:hypothetical protein